MKRAPGGANAAQTLRSIVLLGATLAVATIAWAALVDATWAYLPHSDSALYLDTVRHLSRGEGLVSNAGYEVAPSKNALFPAPFHPAGSLIPYVPAALVSAPDGYAIALATSLALYLGTISLLWIALRRATASEPFATVSSAAFAIDPALLREFTGVATTVPLIFAVAMLSLWIWHAWPPRGLRDGIILGAFVGAIHLIRLADPPIIAAVALLLLVARQWRPLAGVVLGYMLLSVAAVPLLAGSNVAAASLLADTPGFKGFAAAQLDTPSIGVALISYAPQIARKTAANIVQNVRGVPLEMNVLLLVPAIAAVTFGARGDKRLWIVLSAIALTLLYASMLFVGAHYFVHLLFPLIGGAALVLWRSRLPAVQAATLILAFSVIPLASHVQAAANVREQREAVIGAIVEAAALLRSTSARDDTVITDTPADIALYADRRAFNTPPRVTDLGRVERLIGAALFLVIRREQVEDRIAYPDGSWREAFSSDRVGDYILLTTVGTGRAEVRIYRRP